MQSICISDWELKLFLQLQCACAQHFGVFFAVGLKVILLPFKVTKVLTGLFKKNTSMQIGAAHLDYHQKSVDYKNQHTQMHKLQKEQKQSGGIEWV